MDNALIPKDINLPAERMQTAKGLGHIEEEDRVIPRLKIMQPLSPEVDEGLAKSGEFLNSIMKKSYGKELSFIPVIWWKSRVYWAPRDEGGGILCQALDAVHGTVHGLCADCDYAKWHDKETSGVPHTPQCTAIINILSIINQQDLVACSFMKTSYSTGKQLINLFNYKRVDIFNFQYTLYAQQEENDKGKFWVIKYRDYNTAVTDEMYKACASIYENFAKIREKIEDIKIEE